MPRLTGDAKIVLEETMRKTMRNAVFELLAEKELNAISIADVAKKIGVSSMTVYNYYPSRRLLIDDAMNQSRCEMKNKFVEAAAVSSDPTEKLLNLARIICEDFEAHRFLFMARFAVVPQDEENAASAKAYFNSIIDCFAAAIDDGIGSGIFRQMNSKYAAMSFLGALMSFNRHAAFQWLGLSMDERIKEVKKIIIDGFKI
jgi:AcrR family transcriptional regulator